MNACISVTWMTTKGGEVFLVACCEECRLVRERFIHNGRGAAQLAQHAAAEALAEGGCWHAKATLRRERDVTLPEITDLPSVRPPGPPKSSSTRPRREPLPFAQEEVVTASIDPRREL